MLSGADRGRFRHHLLHSAVGRPLPHDAPARAGARSPRDPRRGGHAARATPDRPPAPPVHGSLHAGSDAALEPLPAGAAPQHDPGHGPQRLLRPQGHAGAGQPLVSREGRGRLPGPRDVPPRAVPPAGFLRQPRAGRQVPAVRSRPAALSRRAAGQDGAVRLLVHPHPEVSLLRARGGETRGGQQVWPDPQTPGLSDHRLFQAVGSWSTDLA